MVAGRVQGCPVSSKGLSQTQCIRIVGVDATSINVSPGEMHESYVNSTINIDSLLLQLISGFLYIRGRLIRVITGVVA